MRGQDQWIRVDGGRKRLLSTFVRGKEKLTTWGKKWYRQNPEEYMVHVPVRITYVRRDKSHYTAPESTLPIERRSNLHPQHDNNYYSTILEHIHEKLPDFYTTQSIYQIEVLYHKPPQEWAISRKRVKVKPDGTVEFEAAVDQPLHSFDG